MDGFKIVEESDIQTINLDLDSTMNIGNDSMGIELLADPHKKLKSEGSSNAGPSPKKRGV